MSTNAQAKGASKRKSILELKPDGARTFLLKPDSYFNLELPPYFVLGDLLDGVIGVLDSKRLSDLTDGSQRLLADINYTLFHNKDGKYAWRPFQLIHPALYVSLVNAITKAENWELVRRRFKSFGKNARIRSLGVPVASSSDKKDRAEQIAHWLREVEQCSIEFSLDFEYLFETDIADCYGSIYTHSIVWALYTKREAQKRRNRTNERLLGNIIDWHIQDMRQGQTNGIPQGSVLMDFIAEMVLGLVDEEISDRLESRAITEYRILRYRDDYRVFVNSPEQGQAIIKAIAESCIGYGLKLNSAKTWESNNVVRASIKRDKWAWMARKQCADDSLPHLLLIHDHATNFPNTGSLARALKSYYGRLLEAEVGPKSPKPLIAIVVDIAYRNPNFYPMCFAIVSLLLRHVDCNEEKLGIAKRIQSRFLRLPNTGYMQIWLQRVTWPLQMPIDFEEAMCKVVAGSCQQLWNNDWISSNDLKGAVDATAIVDTSIRNEVPRVINLDEVDLFPGYIE